MEKHCILDIKNKPILGRTQGGPCFVCLLGFFVLLCCVVFGLEAKIWEQRSLCSSHSPALIIKVIMDNTSSHRRQMFFLHSWYKRQRACVALFNSHKTNEPYVPFCSTKTEIAGLTGDQEECVLKFHPQKGRIKPICWCHFHNSFIFSLHFLQTVKLHLHSITLPVQEKGARGLSMLSMTFFFFF